MDNNVQAISVVPDGAVRFATSGGVLRLAAGG